MIFSSKNPISLLFDEIGYDSFVEDDDRLVEDLYVKDINRIKTRKDLVKHIDKWKVIFLSDNIYPNSFEKILTKRFNSKRLFDKFIRIQRGFKSREFEGNGLYYDMAVSILIPAILLDSHFISRKYNVSPNLVLLQKYGDSNVYQ